MVSGLKHLSYKDKLKRLNIISLEEHRVRYLIEAYKILTRKEDIEPQQFFTLNNITLRGHDLKLTRDQIFY